MESLEQIDKVKGSAIFEDEKGELWSEFFGPFFFPVEQFMGDGRPEYRKVGDTQLLRPKTITRIPMLLALLAVVAPHLLEIGRFQARRVGTLFAAPRAIASLTSRFPGAAGERPGPQVRTLNGPWRWC